MRSLSLLGVLLFASFDVGIAGDTDWEKLRRARANAELKKEVERAVKRQSMARGWFEPIPLEESDGIQWEFKRDSRVVAIGDLHADPDAFLSILEHMKLINSEGKWIGGKTQLVLMGDLLDRGPNSRFLLDFIAHLTPQIEAVVGKIHTLYGNHEWFVQSGDLRYLTFDDLVSYSNLSFEQRESLQEKYWERVDAIQDRNMKFLHEGKPELMVIPTIMDATDILGEQMKTYLNAMTHPDSPYAQEIKRRQSIVKIGDDVFVHGGIEEWIVDPDGKLQVDQVNATTRYIAQELQSQIQKQLSEGKVPEYIDAWHQFLLGTEDKRPRGGPQWSRSMNPRMKDIQGEMTSKEVRALREKIGARRFYIAHTPTNSMEIEYSYGKQVVHLDTKISEGYGGNLSAIEISPSGRMKIHNDIPRVAGEHPIRVANELKLQRSFPGEPNAPPRSNPLSGGALQSFKKQICH